MFTVFKKYASIDLDDLHDSQSFSAITLDMRDREKYFEGRTAGDAPNGVQSDMVLYRVIAALDKVMKHSLNRSI